MQLRFRNAINLSKQSSSGLIMALALFDIYFNTKRDLVNNVKAITGKTNADAMTSWIIDLINVGWQLCTNI
jgi:CRISPR-associated protein Cmr2